MVEREGQEGRFWFGIGFACLGLLSAFTAVWCVHHAIGLLDLHSQGNTVTQPETDYGCGQEERADRLRVDSEHAKCRNPEIEKSNEDATGRFPFLTPLFPSRYSARFDWCAWRALAAP